MRAAGTCERPDRFIVAVLIPVLLAGRVTPAVVIPGETLASETLQHDTQLELFMQDWLRDSDCANANRKVVKTEVQSRPLMIGLATPGGFAAAPEASSSSGDAEPASSPRTFQDVWYRTPEDRGWHFLGRQASGTLTVEADAIIFESNKINLTIPMASIWYVESTPITEIVGVAPNSNIVTRTWSAVVYDEDGVVKSAAFRDGSRHGQGDAAILAELRLAEARGHSDPASVQRDTAVGTGAEGLMGEGLVEMRHYSFKMPMSSDGGWRIERPGGPFEEAVLTKQLEPTGHGAVGHVQIKILRNQIVSQDLVKKSARENADKIRHDEKKTMLKEGVKRDLYQLHDVSMGEATISGKHFFLMDYTTETLTDIEPSSLYLLFPYERDNTSFLMVVYTAVIDKRTGATDSSKLDLMSVLTSLELKSVD